MPTHFSWILLTALPILGATGRSNGSAAIPLDSVLPAASANDNRTPGGRRSGDTLLLELTVMPAAWHILGDSNPAFTVAAFAEPGKLPSIPAPLLRVAAGTLVHAVIHDPLDDTLVVHGLSESAAATDSLIVLPETTGEATFVARRPGTYQYWATLASWARRVPLSPAQRQHGLLRPRFDSQLAGAIVVDPPGPVPADRIFVLTETDDEVPVRPESHGLIGRQFTAFNGRSWPYTERLHYAVGDSVRWRFINATFQPHPLHLHGFYFRVDSYGRAQNGIDSIYAPADRRIVVTQGMNIGASFTMVWSPDRPGGWLFHCHLANHIAMLPSVDRPDEMEYPIAHGGNPDAHIVNGMNGLVLGITVTGPARTPPPWHPARRLRLFVQSDSGPRDLLRRFGYVLQRGNEPARDSLETPPVPLVLTRGEPTEIDVVNRTPEPTTVHWHGIEVESYYDGAAGWSGDATGTAPAIRPESAFVVHITPRRAGTFMLHTHFDEMRQQYGGLVGLLVVLEPGQHWDPARDLALLISDGPHGQMLINGSAAPAALDLRIGTTYRLRIGDLTLARSTSVRVSRDSQLVSWRPVAKDGFTLPPDQATMRPSSLGIIIPGETADFEITPNLPGGWRIEFGPIQNGGFRPEIAVPLHVTAP